MEKTTKEEKRKGFHKREKNGGPDLLFITKLFAYQIKSKKDVDK